MWQPKVLTVAGVLAILACGACFLPPIPPPRPRVPPVLAGVRILAIQVMDLSGTDLLEPEPMNSATAAQFNRQWKEYPMQAVAWNPSSTCDAILRITILHKSVSSGKASGERQAWEFEMVADFTMMTPDGRLLWQQPGQIIHFVRTIQASPSSPSWNFPVVFNVTAYNLARHGSQVYFVRSQPIAQEHP